MWSFEMKYVHYKQGCNKVWILHVDILKILIRSVDSSIVYKPFELHVSEYF